MSEMVEEKTFEDTLNEKGLVRVRVDWLHGKHGEYINNCVDHVFCREGDEETMNRIALFPYGFRVDELVKLNELCEKNGYVVKECTGGLLYHPKTVMIVLMKKD